MERAVEVRPESRQIDMGGERAWQRRLRTWALHGSLSNVLALAVLVSAGGALTLNSVLDALSARVRAHAQLGLQIDDAGTTLTMLTAALLVVTLVRRFDRTRRRLADELHVQATHDPLTGLANRRQLSLDLAAAASVATMARPARLAVFDLDGFKAYNDSFGHDGGDLLLRRLSRALFDVVEPVGASYRLGGDEFCVLLRDGADEQILLRCVEALSESGDAFVVTSSYGSVLLPVETANADVALQLADERMHEDKDSGLVSVSQQTRDLALKMLSAQEPDLEHHSAHVAELAVGVGERLGLTPGECARSRPRG